MKERDAGTPITEVKGVNSVFSQVSKCMCWREMDLGRTTRCSVFFLELLSCSVFSVIPDTPKPQDCIGYDLAVFTSLLNQWALAVTLYL